MNVWGLGPAATAALAGLMGEMIYSPYDITGNNLYVISRNNKLYRLSIMITIMIFFLEGPNSYGGHGMIPMLRFGIVCLELQLEVRVGCLHFPVITFTMAKENSIKSTYFLG